MDRQEISGGMNDTPFAIAYMLLFIDLIVIHTLWLRVILFCCVITLVAIYVHKGKAK